MQRPQEKAVCAPAPRLCRVARRNMINRGMIDLCDQSACPGMGQTVQSLSLKVGEDRIHYLKAGSGSPVLFLHGGACDSGDWIETMTALSGYCTCYAPDMVGYGLSDSNRDVYSLGDFVGCVRRFIETLDLGDLVLVGHSLGGRVCLEIALQQPERVRKLVVVDMAGFSRMARFGRLITYLAWALRELRGRPQPYPRFSKQDGGYGGWLCLEQLPALKTPTLIVWSRYDPYYPLSAARRAAELIPQARLEVLACCGHAPHRKKHDTFVRLLLDCVASASGAGHPR
ncbi:MAG: hypothetical protein DRI39_04060 [Chloroflexi bacterium]|nr:MAG: hypothetical protein DRI39_04060 [Chloroflexota bacterium]